MGANSCAGQLSRHPPLILERAGTCWGCFNVLMKGQGNYHSLICVFKFGVSKLRLLNDPGMPISRTGCAAPAFDVSP